MQISLISIQALVDQQDGFLEAVPKRLPLSLGENVELDLCIATNKRISEALINYGKNFATVIPNPRRTA